MLENFIISRIKAELPFKPNEEKEELFQILGILVSTEQRKCFILKGYAGTGKTSVVSALVRAMEKLQQTCILLAPTGRAAKVLARYSGYPAFTIHKWIYRQDSSLKETFSVAENKFNHALFIIDEASMISAYRDNETFGTGSLLDDLVRYVYSGKECSILLLGDDAQLPPVGSSESKALDSDFLSGYGLNVSEYCLTQVARQALDSGILRNATTIREKLNSFNFNIQITPAEDVKLIHGVEIQELIERSYAEVGDEETIILTRTNRRTNLYNQGIRASVFWKEDMVSNGDRLMVSKNNYFWSKSYEKLPFLANGDILEIKRLRNERELYGFHFVDASMRMVDYDYEIDAILWIDTLMTNSPEESYQLQRELFEKIAEDYPEIHNKRDMMKTILENEYYNALQIRFAYAVTCHKAQGGQWKRVFIDPDTPNPTHEMNLNDEKDYMRWYYTALTRATETVYILTPDKKKD